MNHRIGDWIITYNGKKFYPLDPKVKDVLIEDIAHALSNICRYAGHCNKFYSVAQHSVMCNRLIESTDYEMRMWALLHDASEAYISDIPSPLKRSLTEYKKIEANIMHTVAMAFNLDPIIIPEKIHYIDSCMLATEWSQLMNVSLEETLISSRPLPFITINVLSPHEAKKEFLSEFNEINQLRRR